MTEDPRHVACPLAFLLVLQLLCSHLLIPVPLPESCIRPLGGGGGGGARAAPRRRGTLAMQPSMST